jgi:hypothetical protein
MKWVVLFWTGWDPILLNPVMVVMVDEGRNCKIPLAVPKCQRLKVAL